MKDGCYTAILTSSQMRIIYLQMFKLTFKQKRSMFVEPAFNNKGNFLAVKDGEERWFETYREARTWYKTKEHDRD